ncbi:MAG: DUF2723 domain-containing protein [Bacteroidales bacterium]|nr:DUF2723 domain-containing protein [Bacteroidales bacterium]MCF8403723.1 DUF2723 domain-containing protein [Bacteroidales bacterium]
MNSYQKLNNIIGWVIFAIASIVYILTIEPSASFWDCGEYIATAYKLQVGHPPGAPLFQIIGRFFSLFAFGDTSKVAMMVNLMSAFSSSFTILFLFWTLTKLAKKLALRSGEMTEAKQLAIFGSAAVGSLAYTFSDSFWFSATEGEVYAMSSFFTALVFWAILKWDENADEPHASRWLIFIAYMVGLSVGVHLLNLLAIPAIAFVYYFRKYKAVSRKGIIVTFITSIIVLGLIMSGIIPLIVKLAGLFELFFVNTIGMPFNSGTIIYFLILLASIYLGIRYTRRRQKVILNTLVWAFTFILIGYSSFFLLIIRSNANTPIDENNPEDAISLLSYLNREQYGDWPILYGQYFNAPIADRKDGKPVYRKSVKDKKYIVIDKNEKIIPVYTPEFSTIFPRMWNNTEKRYETDYKIWSRFKGVNTTVTDEYGEKQTRKKPTFRENLRYFWRYQVNHMYIRYFMWNFAGKQDDIQGMADQKNGNWISGIPFIDQARLGPVNKVPESMKNKARNKFYLFPLLLGLIGLIYQIRKDYKNSLVVGLLFIMTGLAIVVYLNQHAPQPRERDYAYAASFYAFAIWIGLGTYGLFDLLRKKIKSKLAVTVVSLGTLILVPGIMAKEGWDDHDRSGRKLALAMASNYLNSCEPNAILFTNGDNDTFPLWYAQEVEGIRTDVRVINLSLLNTEWYIEQMKRKAYESEPVPFSLEWEQYKDGTRNYTYFIENENVKGFVELKQLFDIINTNPDRLTMQTRVGPIEYFPTKKVKITIDSAQAIKTGTVKPEDAHLMVKEIQWKLKGSGITKNQLMVLDLLAHNNWERPVYFAITTGLSAYMGLEDYFQIEGMTYRLVPIKTPRQGGMIGRVNNEGMYDNLMNKFLYGNMSDPDIYLDETNMRMTMNIRNIYGRLGSSLIDDGKTEEARNIFDRCMEVLPDDVSPYDYYTLPIAEGYLDAGDTVKGNEIFNRMIDIIDEQMNYFFLFDGKWSEVYDFDKQQGLAMLQNIVQVARKHKQKETQDKANAVLDKYYDLYSN